MAAPLFGFCVRSHSMVKDSSSHNKYAVQSSCGTQQQDTTDARGSPSRYSDVSRPTSTTQPIQHMTTRHIDSARHERGSRSTHSTGAHTDVRASESHASRQVTPPSFQRMHTCMRWSGDPRRSRPKPAEADRRWPQITDPERATRRRRASPRRTARAASAHGRRSPAR